MEKRPCYTSVQDALLSPYQKMSIGSSWVLRGTISRYPRGPREKPVKINYFISSRCQPRPPLAAPDRFWLRKTCLLIWLRKTRFLIISPEVIVISSYLSPSDRKGPQVIIWKWHSLDSGLFWYVCWLWIAGPGWMCDCNSHASPENRTQYLFFQLNRTLGVWQLGNGSLAGLVIRAEISKKRSLKPVLYIWAALSFPLQASFL